jgi:hypothetical protein
VEASLRDVQEDLEIQQETTKHVAVTLDTWQGRFDRAFQVAAAAGKLCVEINQLFPNF